LVGSKRLADQRGWMLREIGGRPVGCDRHAAEPARDELSAIRTYVANGQVRLAAGDIEPCRSGEQVDPDLGVPVP
jgi:hypothetical protein